MHPVPFGITLLGLTLLLGLSLADTCSNRTDQYDYVVVGGGTAGLALASRLSQNLPQSCIVVLEAGPDARSDPNIYIPGYRGRAFGTALDWNLTTVPQPGLNNRTVAHTRGRVLGGSSALNLMSWDRASKQEYDLWEQLGNLGWNWESMYPAMLDVETFNRTTLGPGKYEGDGVGDDGPVDTWINEIVPVQQRSFIPTLANLGVAENLHSLDGHPLGVMYQPSNILRANMTRSYSTEYLAIAGCNVILKTNAAVQKVNLNANNTRATGVTLVSGQVINAVKEVILSAGTLQSPQILELSGIGRSDIISAAGITPLVSLDGVGENLQDHLRIQNSYQVKSNYTTFDIVRFNTSRAAEELALYNDGQPSLYLYTGSGYSFVTWDQALGPNNTLASLATSTADTTNIIDRMKLSLYSNSSLASAVPQLEIIFSDGYTGVRGYPAATSADYGKQFFTLIAAIMHPFTRGTVHINSTLATDKPIIDPNYLSNDYDVAAATAASQYLRKIANTYPLSQVWQDEFDPGTTVNTDAEWEQYIRNNAGTIYHPVGTCAMLPKEEGGVVNSKLQVYGVSNLRVVDASVIPMILSAHIQTAVYGIAERAAKIIAADATL